MAHKSSSTTSSEMTRHPQIILAILVLLSLAYWVMFCFPNSTGAKDTQMLMAFEPDEAVPLPYVFDMIKPAATLKEALLNFAFYDYYFYGFPHFAYSAFVLLPLCWLGSLDSIPLVMIFLRQMVSVLPMLAAILLMVYLQTGFRSYKAIVLFILLASLPALVQNNYWWHPDSLAILFAILTIFFLSKDDLKLKRFFYIAAAMCGISAAIKGIGFYFFGTILVYLLLTFFQKKASVRKILLAGCGFILAMGAAFLVSNPILIYAPIRERYFYIMREQSILLGEGYEIQYAKGVLASLPLFTQSYGSLWFILLAFAANIWGIARGPRRLLHILILSWSVPITILITFFIHFKSQYWLPVAIAFLSSFACILPESLSLPAIFRADKKRLIFIPVALIIAVQWLQFVHKDSIDYIHGVRRETESSFIQFYQVSLPELAPLPSDRGYRVYFDVNMYVPGNDNWNKESIFEMLNYAYIDEKGFDILYLMQQRIYDYLNPEVEGIDPQKLEESRRFYRDANEDALRGYQLVFRNAYGLVYVKDTLYAQFFPPR
jgi:hypothetical protein